jgi:hypothetical protein
MSLSKISKTAVTKEVFISDIADEFSIRVESISSGNFNYRCRCPNPDHKHGSERTSSCYIDSINNNFYCFGCGANNNVIDFYMLCSGSTFIDSLTELSKRVPAGSSEKYSDKVRGNNLGQMIRISILIRTAFLNNPKDFDFIDRVSKLASSYISKIGPEDKKSAIKLYEKIEWVFRDRELK